MTKTLLRSTALAVVLGFAGPAVVLAETPSTQAAAQSASTVKDVDHQRAEEIIGTDVVGSNGDVIGDITDLVIGPDGNVTHAIIAVGGVLGIGETDVVVPYERAKPTSQDGMVRVSISEDELKAMPRFDYGKTDDTAGIDAYREKAETNMTAWQTRVDELSSDAKSTTKEASAEAKQALDSAWVDVKSAWSELQSATADGWQEAKANFEEAMDRLDRAWTELTSEA